MPAFPIAIIGMACRLPGAADLDAFWRLLRDGVDAVGDVPSDRWDQQAYFSADPDAPGKLKSPAGGFIADIDKFDAEFFGISPREARKMDPQQRLLLEVTWEALENAGLAPSRLAGSQTGVYVGVSSSDYASLQQPFVESADAYCMTGGALSIAANRLSYVFDLHGPSLSIDTACSSALVALHHACAALRRGEIPLALVGGVNALLTPYNSVGFSKAHMLSPNGRCRAFDADGDGYVRAEGCGMVVLKPLAAALAEGDDVVAVIHGTGVNSDGRTKGISLPNPDAQERLLRDVYDEFGIDAADVRYVEAHGTGTPVGDPAECAALGRVIGAGRAPGAPLMIGSVKTNIGHLESGSGVAGLIKTALALKHREIPASLHFKTPNPNIPFDDLHLKVVTRTTPLPSEGPLLAGINSFGFGGTNAHAILGEGTPARASSHAASTSAVPLLITARSRESLAELAGRYANLLRADNAPSLAALAHAVAARREVLPHRLAVVAADANGAAKALDAFAADPEAPVDGAVSGEALATAPRVAFVFSGNGSQWRGMGRSLLVSAPVFAAAVVEIDAALRPIVGWSVRNVLMSDEAATAYDKTQYAQPALFAVQVGIVRWLAAQGIDPDAAVGHSVGEVAAAYVCGALSLPQACRVIAERSRAQSATAGQGRMAAVGLSREDAEASLAEFGDKLTLAAINGPNSVTLAGDGAALDALGEALKAKNVFFRALDINYAFHSPAMDPIRDGLIGALAGLSGRDCDIPFVSTVEGRAVGGASLGADYWWRNVREPVNFAGAIDALLAEGVTLFVEIGPRPVLDNYLREIFKSDGRRALSVSTLRPDRPELPELRLAQARLAVAGKIADAERAFNGEAPRIALPTMAWRKRRHWFLDGKELFVAQPTGKREHPLLGRRLATARPNWTNQLDTASLPHLKDHVVGGQALFPAAGYLEMALAALAKTDGGATVEIDGLDIRRPLPVGAQMRPLVASALADMDGSFSVTAAESEEALSAAQPIMVCRVGIADALAGDPVDLDALRARLGDPIGAQEHYRQCLALGLDYGPAYQGVAEIRKGENEALGRIVAPAAIVQDLAAYRWHPAMLDACLQVVVGVLGEGVADGALVLPTGAGRARFALGAPGALWCHAKVTRVARRDIFADLILMDDSGARIGSIENLRLRRVETRGASRADFYHWERMLRLPDQASAPAAPVALAARVGDGDDGIFARRLDALILAYVRPALAELGGGESIVPTELAAQGVTDEGARRLTKTLVDLQSHGLAAREGGRWRLGSADGDDADALWRAMLADFPGRWALLDAIARRGVALAREWRGGEIASPARLNAETDEALRRTRATAQDFIQRQCLAANAPMRALELGDGAPELLGDLAERHPHDAEWLFLDAATAAPEGALTAMRLGDAPEMQALTGAVGLVVVDGARREIADTLALAKRLLSSGGCLVVLSAPDMMASDFLGATPAPAWREALTKAGFALAAGGDSLLIATAPLRAPTAQSSEKRTFAALTDANDLSAAALITRLKDAGHEVSVDETGHAVNASVYLYLRTGSAAPDAAAPGFDLVALAQALDAAKPGQPASIIVVTRGALEPFAGRAPSAMGALWGVARTIANERANLSFRMIDTDDLASEALLAELSAERGEEDQIVLRGGKRFALRLRRALPLAPVAPETPYRLTRDASEGLAFEAIAAPVPAPGEVLVRVKAAALNFRDVLQRLDVLPDEAFDAGFAGATLGMEMAGEVLAVGAGVSAFKPGDAVFGFAKAAMASHVAASAGALFPKPEAWSFAAAASLPVVALTVAYSLGTLARLEKGETILIHGAAGGVGLAAVQYARQVGATIFATAGAEERRDFVRRLGVEHVFDSRSLAFADEIRAATGGRGVDVVLNSLSGEALVKSVSVLAPYGRFVELGKRDFYANSKLGLQPFRNNLQFHGVDVDQLLRDRPDVALKTLAPMLAQGGLFRPLAHSVFPETRAHEAFRRLQQSKQIGKVVLAFDAPCPPGAKPIPRLGFALSPDATYLVTGGRRGFGLASAKWLASRGARHLALIGRHPGDAAAQATIAKLAQSGAEMREFSADVADESALATIKATMPPLRGIIHAAAVFDDCALANLTSERFAAVMRPKVLGARNLDALTRDTALDFFVLFSSATTLMGNPGQANYVAANAAMESLAAERRARGAPGLAVAWGAIGEVGHVAEDDKLAKSLTEKIGLALLPPRRAFAMLEEALASPAAMVGIAALDWRRLAVLPSVARSPAFAALREGAGQDDSAADEDVAEFAKRLATLPPREALELVTRRIADHVAKVTQAEGGLDPGKPIVEFGLDSLMAVELQMGLEKQFAVSLPMLDMHSLTIGGLAKKMLDALGARGEEATAPQAPPARSSEDAISDLLSAEIDRVKAKRETAAVQ